MDEAEAIQAGRYVLDRAKQADMDNTLLVEAELLASERLMTPCRFLFMTPHHRKLVPFRVHETYTGLKGQQRIKLVDHVGRCWHYDRDEIVYAGLFRELKPWPKLATLSPALPVRRCGHA